MRQEDRPHADPHKEHCGAVTEKQPDIDPKSKGMTARRRATKAVCIFGAVFVLGMLLRFIAVGRPGGLPALANFITVVGFLGVGWWGSVLYDLIAARR